MSTETVTRTRERVEQTPPLVHIYPRDPAYRLSGSIPMPQPGDIARCGFRKQLPGGGPLYGAPVSCVVCAALNDGAT